jgi:hypothetical protein
VARLLSTVGADWIEILQGIVLLKQNLFLIPLAQAQFQFIICLCAMGTLGYFKKR